VKIVRYGEESAIRWDAFLPQTVQGVFLHSRNFLAYHKDRFEDLSLLIEDDKGRLRSLLPAARSLSDHEQVISHPGITYGGLLHHPSCKADEILAMMAGIRDWYRELGFRSLSYKAVPVHVQSQLVQSDLYALWREGGVLARRDLWNALDLGQPRKVSEGHKWALKKARAAGLAVAKLDVDDYTLFHEMLTTGLMKHHGAKPVHSLEELLDLQQRFTQHIELWGCRASDGELLAASWLFKLSATCWHTQYIISNDRGRDLFATDLMLEELIGQAVQSNIRHFSFGCSTDQAGRHLNAGLFSFKAGFGDGAVTHDFYELEL
jgi:hypothetical protein